MNGCCAKLRPRILYARCVTCFAYGISWLKIKKTGLVVYSKIHALNRRSTKHRKKFKPALPNTVQPIQHYASLPKFWKREMLGAWNFGNLMTMTLVAFPQKVGAKGQGHYPGFGWLLVWTTRRRISHNWLMVRCAIFWYQCCRRSPEFLNSITNSMVSHSCSCYEMVWRGLIDSGRDEKSPGVHVLVCQLVDQSCSGSFNGSWSISHGRFDSLCSEAGRSTIVPAQSLWDDVEGCPILAWGK